MPAKQGSQAAPNNVFRYTALVFVLNLVVAVFLLLNHYSSLQEKEANEARTYGNHVAATIRLSVLQSLTVTETLRSHYLEHGEAFLQSFDHVAERLMSEDPCIGSLYYAPKGVVAYAYPEKVRQATIGFEMFKDKEQGAMALKAFSTHQPTMAGPHNLVEGGQGFIIRNPVYRMTGEFEGMVVCVMNWDRMVARTLDDVGGSEKYDIGVWKDYDTTVVTDANGYIFTTGPVGKDRDLDIAIPVPNDIWHLTVQPKNPNDLWLTFLPYLMYYLLSLLALTGTVYLALSRMQAMREVEQQAVQAKDAFFANLSHDIRTPLNGIMGMVAIARKNRQDQAKVEDCLQKITDVSNHLLLLVNDILDIRRIESGKLELDMGDMELVRVCRSCADVVQGQADKGGLMLEVDLTALPPTTVHGDERSFRQIIVNILGNAVKFTPAGGRVYFSAVCVEENQDSLRVRFTIRDTGIGMSQEFLQKIWQAFSQENSQRVNKLQQGTGLGMNIAKNLVELMDGTIEVTSRPGHGTCFVVEIPFTRCHHGEAEARPDVASLDLSGLRMLLVEDNELNLEIALELFSEQGCLVETAENGQEALEKFQASAPGYYDIIVTDIMMPLMDGIEETKRIRGLAREDARTIPIVAMTANAFKEDRDKTKDVGFSAYLTKPIDVEAALLAIARLTGRV